MTSIFNFLPESYKNKENSPNLYGLLQAIKAGDDHVIELLSNARDQLFLTTASGSYLVNLANSFGFAIPPNSGLDESGFRALSIPAIWSPKQSIPTINKIVEIFYSSAVLHPFVLSTELDKYSLQDGDSLVFETEDGLINVLFDEDKFANIASVSASEVASTINAQSNGKLFAEAVLDRVTSRYKVRVVAKNFGSAAKIRISGGSAQNVIKFERLVDSGGLAGTEWNITKFANATYSGVVRFTWSGVGADPQTFNLNYGDLVTIRNLVDGTAEFSKLNGSYRVVDAGADYFEIASLSFQETGVSYTQVSDNEIIFSSKEYKTLFDNSEYAIVSETAVGVIDISIPAVPPIVRRQLQGAARLRGSTEIVLDILPGQFVVPYPNLLPESGTFIYDSDRFSLGLDNRFYKYSSKNAPIGDTQVLNLDPAGHQLPFLSAAEANAGLGVIQSRNPIFAEVDSPEIIVDTQQVKHWFEHAQEITIEGATTNISIADQKTVTSIFLPADQDSTYFEHDMDSDALYVQFWAEDTNELAHLDYRPDSIDPLNRIQIDYLPEMGGRTVKAVLVKIVLGAISGQVTAELGPEAANPLGGTNVYPHLFNTPLTTFMAIDSDVRNKVIGLREVITANDVQFTYAEQTDVNNFSVFAIDHQNIFPELTRVVATNITLPASPMSENAVTVVHNLFSGNLIVEVKVKDPGTTSLPDESFIEFLKIVTIDDTKFEIRYNGLTDDISVDVFILASFFNPVESVSGSLLLSQINAEHVVKRRISDSKYAFEILGTGVAPYGSGTITSMGKIVTGTGTAFLIEASPGDLIILPDGQEREVASVIDNDTLELEFAFSPSIGSPTIYKIASPEANDTPEGEPVTYNGAIIFGFNVTYNPDPDRGTDIRFVFPDRVSREAAGFVDGTRVRLIPSEGIDFQTAPAAFLKGSFLTVNSQEGSDVFLYAGIGATPGVIISGAKARRSGYFGGSSFVHYIKKPLSDFNQNTWFKNKKIYLIDTNERPNPLYLGSYVYDTIGTESPFVLGATSTTIQSPVVAFSAPGVLSVDSVSGFPSTGYIFLDFGNDRFEGPIKYSLIIPGTPASIRIDPAYVFKQSHSTNAVVRLASSISKVELKTDASQYPVYITGATEARRTLELILKSLVSAGVKLQVNLQLPELRFYEKSLQPFL